MLRSYISAWKRPFDFKGISNRKEYWYFNIFSIILFILINVFTSLINNLSFVIINDPRDLTTISDFLYILSKTIDISNYFLICGFLWTCLPLSVRRIRDVGMAWQWIFLSIIPYIGNIFNLIFLTRPSVLEIDGVKYFKKY